MQIKCWMVGILHVWGWISNHTFPENCYRAQESSIKGSNQRLDPRSLTCTTWNKLHEGPLWIFYCYNNRKDIRLLRRCTTDRFAGVQPTQLTTRSQKDSTQPGWAKRNKKHGTHVTVWPQPSKGNYAAKGTIREHSLYSPLDQPKPSLHNTAYHEVVTNEEKTKTVPDGMIWWGGLPDSGTFM